MPSTPGDDIDGDGVSETGDSLSFETGVSAVVALSGCPLIPRTPGDEAGVSGVSFSEGLEDADFDGGVSLRAVFV
jgi:hypothetical protein